jgi:hypothetical protein
MADEYMSKPNIALIVSIVILTLVIICLVFFTSDHFKNLTYGYKLPTLGRIPNLQSATVPRMLKSEEPTSSEEPSSSEEVPNSQEPSSSEEPRASDEIYSDETMLLGLYLNEKKNMNSYGNYKIITPSRRKQESEEINNLLKRLDSASNSGIIDN